MRNLNHLSEIFHYYDTYVIDLWGVMHNGINLNPKAIEVLEGALEQLQPFVLDDDQDGTANQCDNCIDSHLYDTGNFDFSEEFLIDGLDYGLYPSIDVLDVLLLADLVANGEEISPCFIEASDFTNDNTLDIVDVFALAQYVAQGN